MQAVIKTGGKQFSVNTGDVIQVEKLAGNPGEEIEFNEVLMISDDKGAVTVGTPILDKAVVKGKIIGEMKGKKIDVFQFKRRKDSKKKAGHRQVYTTVEITDISN